LGTFLIAAEKQTSHSSSKRTRRRVWGTTGWSGSPYTLGILQENPPGNSFQVHEELQSLGTASLAFPRANHV